MTIACQPEIYQSSHDEAYVSNALKAAINVLVIRDWYLLEHKVQEQAATHKLAQYLEPFFPGYQVDCEYSKIPDGGAKVLANYHCNNGSEVRPDIIIHKRGTLADNLVVIEAKLDPYRDIKCDRLKVREYLADVNYDYGYVIKLPRKRNGIFEVFNPERIFLASEYSCGKPQNHARRPRQSTTEDVPE